MTVVEKAQLSVRQSVFISHSERGVASVPVSPIEEGGVAFVLISCIGRGITCECQFR